MRECAEERGCPGGTGAAIVWAYRDAIRLRGEAMNAMMMDRTAMTGNMMPTGMTGSMPAQSWMMMPRCTYKFEKVQGGMKMTCMCDDPVACSMMQNLCQALAGGLCGWTCTFNGVAVCSCNWVMGMLHRHHYFWKARRH